jgi:hypothetical protein
MLMRNLALYIWSLSLFLPWPLNARRHPRLVVMVYLGSNHVWTRGLKADEISNGEVCGHCECLLQLLMTATNRHNTITTEPGAYSCHNTSVIYNPNSAVLVSCIQIQSAKSYHPSSAEFRMRGHVKSNEHPFYYVLVLDRRHFLIATVAIM